MEWSFTRIPPKGDMPEGYKLRMPFAEQYVILSMWRLAPGFHGAFHFRVTSHLPEEETLKNALAILGILASFMVTDTDPITEELAGGVAVEFYHTWTTGTVASEVAALRDGFVIHTDDDLIHWATVRRLET